MLDNADDAQPLHILGLEPHSRIMGIGFDWNFRLLLSNNGLARKSGDAPSDSLDSNTRGCQPRPCPFQFELEIALFNNLGRRRDHQFLSLLILANHIVRWILRP